MYHPGKSSGKRLRSLRAADRRDALYYSEDPSDGARADHPC